MARYQYAKDEQGNTVKATDLIGTQISSEYICLGCENPLVAKVNGKIKKPHFAHKAIQECNGETYLHRLGKQVFYDTYQKCLAEMNLFTLHSMCLKNVKNLKELFESIVI